MIAGTRMSLAGWQAIIALVVVSKVCIRDHCHFLQRQSCLPPPLFQTTTAKPRLEPHKR
ncbi:hypothetical protein PAXRUDRAFT_831553, partial [Paxillus rubicundulus Ve08.2h10]